MAGSSKEVAINATHEFLCILLGQALTERQFLSAAGLTKSCLLSYKIPHVRLSRAYGVVSVKTQQTTEEGELTSDIIVALRA